jgi:hypothetical protein
VNGAGRSFGSIAILDFEVGSIACMDILTLRLGDMRVLLADLRSKIDLPGLVPIVQTVRGVGGDTVNRDAQPALAAQLPKCQHEL